MIAAPMARVCADVVGAYAAAGVVAVLSSWMSSPELSRDELIECLVATFPAWWTR